MKKFEFPKLKPLLFRHAEDAAFYWLQLDRAVDSASIDFARLSHFDLLLGANLDGLRVAGHAGWSASFSSLQRWRKPGEAFVCTWLALHLNEAPLLEQVIDVVNQCPDVMLRGIISAFARTAPDRVAHMLVSSPTLAGLPAIHVAQLRASALMNASIGEASLLEHFSSDRVEVRAAACRAARTTSQSSKIVSLLESALSESDLAVRAEAAISSLRFRDHNESKVALVRCVQSQAALAAAASGWDRKHASRRLNRWARHLALAIPLDAPEIKETMDVLARRDALSFVLWLGDTQHLPFVIEMMELPEVSRYAGWVWQSLLGINLTKYGLTLPEPPPDSIATNNQSTALLQHAETGLPAPNVTAIRAYVAAGHGIPAPRKRVLLGHELSAAHAFDVLQNAPQAFRSIAASALNHAQHEVYINVRAPALQQRATIDALQHLNLEKVAA